MTRAMFSYENQVEEDVSRHEIGSLLGSAKRSLTLIDVLRWRAEQHGDEMAYTFLSSGESEHVTYADLDRRARAISVRLLEVCSPGDRVLLLYPPGLEFVAAFWGCMYGGMIAVPAYPPHGNKGALRVHAIAEDCGAKLALSTKSMLPAMSEALHMMQKANASQCVTTEDVSTKLADGWREPNAGKGTVVLIQYTSGSTASPKGVVVSHGNLMANEMKIQLAFKQSRQSVIVSWLPLYHDMGLIGSVLQSVFVGALCIMFSAVRFLQRPFEWLQVLSDYGATTSGGPNFAYDLCVRKTTVEERSTLDLSSWSVAFNGAEPVRAGTLDRFAAYFEPCGFRPEAFRPCYGLAESTLLVSASFRSGPPKIERFEAKALEADRSTETPDIEGGRLLVGCGSALPHENLSIVHPRTRRRCLPGEVGEIWLSGPSVAQGYWNQIQATIKTFRARLSDTDEGPFLRTGDLGFVNGDELFVTGRLKDIIIIRGRNHYPQDIESTVVASHAALRPGCGAAFPIEFQSEERLAIVQEVDRWDQAELSEVITRIREAVVEHHELNPHTIVLVKHGSIPKTSSGKIQRRACKAEFLAGTLVSVTEWTNVDALEGRGTWLGSTAELGRPDVESFLKSRIAQMVGKDARYVDAQTAICKLGLDSLGAAELAHDIETGYGLALPLTTILQSPSIAQLAAEVEHGR